MNAQHSGQCDLHIEGDVLEKESKHPIDFASIYIAEMNRSILADENGFYKIPDICAGDYTLYISHYDCLPDTIHMHFDKDIHIDILLKHKNHLLDAVEIKDKRKEEKLINNQNLLVEKDIDKNGGNNLGTLLKELPGVNTMSTGVGIAKPVITGMHSIRVVTLNDGIRLEGQQWGAEHAPEIDINTAGEVSVEKGADALQYSHEAIGGLVIIKPKSLINHAGYKGVVALNASSVNAKGGISLLLEGQFKKTPNWSWRIQSNTIRAGNTKTPSYYLKNTGLNENDFAIYTSYFRSKWKLNLSYKFYNLKLGIFAGSQIGNLSDLLIAYTSEEPLDKDGFRFKINAPKQNIEHHMANTDFTLVVSPLIKMNIKYGFQFNKRQEFDKVLGRSVKDPISEFYLYTNTADIDWSFKNKKATYKSNLGLNSTFQNNYVGGAYFIPAYNSQSIGLYTIHKVEKNKWVFQMGARGDLSLLQVNEIKNKSVHINHRWYGIAGNLGIAYHIDIHSTISMTLGSTWRAPHPVELYSSGVHHGTASIEIGNASLKNERAYLSSIDYTYEEGSRHHVIITLYNKYVTDYIYLQVKEKAQLTIRGAFPVFEYKQTNANFTGADMYYKIDLSKGFEVSQKISLLYVYNLKEKNYLPFIPPLQSESKLCYTLPLHKKIDDFKIGLIGTYVAKQNLTESYQELVESPKAYFLLGFESGLSINRKKQSEPIFIFFNIQNLLNTKYRDYMNRWRYFANEPGINFSLKIKIPFTLK